jgi:hypothetical protein
MVKIVRYCKIILILDKRCESKCFFLCSYCLHILSYTSNTAVVITLSLYMQKPSFTVEWPGE